MAPSSAEEMGEKVVVTKQTDIFVDIEEQYNSGAEETTIHIQASVAEASYESMTEELVEALNAAKLTPSSPKTAPGHLGNLSIVETSKLYLLWGMFLEYLQRPFDKKEAKKDKKLISQIYQQSIETASSISSLAESEKSIASSSRSSAIQANPLALEFWSQAATGDLDVLVLRFLRARKWIVEEAFDMLVSSIRWRYSYDVRKLLAEGDSGIKASLLESGKSFFFKTDRQNRLISVITARLHDKYAQTLEETTRFTVHLMELGRRLMLPGTETVTIIFDLANAPMSSLDLGSMQFMVQCFQNYYPESLGKCLVVNPTWLFTGFYKIVRPMLDPVVAAKVEIIGDMQELNKFIASENLLKTFGGTSDYEYKYIPEVEPGKKIKELSADEIRAIEEEIDILQTKLVDTTIAIHSLFANPDLEIYDDDPTLIALTELRDILKRELTNNWARLEATTFVPSFYHRLGVIAQDGKVDWSAL